MVDPQPAIRIVCITHRGTVRGTNQDAIAVRGWIRQAPMSRPEIHELSGAGPHLVLIADGMGGHAAGEWASLSAVRFLCRRLKDALVISVVEEGVSEVNRWLFERASLHPHRRGAGTTIAGAVISLPRVLTFNVGDTRIMTLRGGYLCQLSTDDTLDPARAQYDPLRPSTPGPVTQAIAGSAQRTRIQPHVRDGAWPEDQPMFLCSDGLLDAVPLDGLEPLVDEDDRVTVHRWIHAAICARARDNVSIIAMRWWQAGATATGGGPHVEVG
jgi:PPM family protein phosphatase